MSSENGFSLINALLAMGIFVTVCLSLSQLMMNQKVADLRIDASDRASENVVRMINSLYNLDFYSLVAYCKEKNAIGAPRTGQCIDHGVLRTTGSTDNRDIEYGLEQPLDKNGILTVGSDLPSMCIEIRECKVLARGHILEMTLNEYWQEPGYKQSFHSKLRSFRKSRW